VAHGREYGISYAGGPSFRDAPHEVRLADLGLRAGERFLYEYDITDGWRPDVRVEQILPLETTRPCPVCTGGRRAVPPEDCGGPWAFMELRQHHAPFRIAERLVETIEAVLSRSDDVDDLRDELEAKFAGLVSYGLGAGLLSELLPLGRRLHAMTLRRHVQATAQRLEDELGPEQATFIEGCPRDWEDLPRPDLPLTVGLDGGYVHATEQRSRREGWFEVIAGKSMPAEGEAKCFGFVQTVRRFTV